MATAMPAVSSHGMRLNKDNASMDSSDTTKQGDDESRPNESSNMIRSASYTYFPQVKDSMFEDSTVVELKGKISEDELTGASNGDAGSYSSSGGSSPESESETAVELNPLSTVPTQQAAGSARSRSPTKQDQQKIPNSASAAQKTPSMAPATQRPSLRSPSRSLTNLRRKSWISNSRSTSPTKASAKKDNASKEEGASSRWSFAVTRRKSIISRSQDTEKLVEDTKKPEAQRRPTTLTKKSSRLSSVLRNAPGSLDIPSPLTRTSTQPSPKSPPIPKSYSTERLPSMIRTNASTEHIPPMPRALSTEKLKSIKAEVPRKKDELWSVFRELDSNFHKFQNKSITMKAGVVRSTLLIFLRDYATHASNTKLRPEDLDRRVNILNKWWTGLLEMLHGRNNQSMSGIDRPAMLDGILGIMERPEWRLSPSPFCPLAERRPMASRTASSTSISSTTSDFLAESVYHNVRNIFIQNLLGQMAFVIDKMSMRTAPASLVTFCGKACAYAFFFCQGVPNVLVRLWSPSLDTMRRVLDESGVTKHSVVGETSKRILSAFPANLHTLGFSTLVKSFRSLRKPVSPPLGTANLQWYGPWVKRWAGTDSELFYVFVKHYHILVTEFLPPQASAEERICVPGLVMVHAQILTNLDATVHRNATSQQEEAASGPAPITFDDVLADPDATASTLPLAPTNATRLMAENRLIILLRDVLSERGSSSYAARQLFAETFSALLRASARRISVYDQNACYTLCDFLEEAMVILVRYENSTHGQSVLDWPFWLSVCRKMVDSQNTSTEIRLYAFLYSIWVTVISDPERRADICLKFLLQPDFFESRFNHWCPMVRAYYMRLLCWRVARFDGDESPEGTMILQSLAERLRSVWSHFSYLKENAERGNALLPSTAPCNPAPSRRLLIIRTDAPMAQAGGPFLSFDGIVPSSSTQATAYKRHSSLGPLADAEIRPTSSRSITSDSSDFDADEDTSKKRWSFFRTIIGVTKSRSKSRSPGPNARESAKNGPAKSDKSNSPAPNSASKLNSPEQEKSVALHRTYCFRFSLEWVDKRFQTAGNMRLQPPRLPTPAQTFLQSRANSPQKASSSKPPASAMASCRYSGRALAEWSIIIVEYQNFFERRKNEGVPSNKQVETPSLGVEAFRRPG